jgi:hypothetical protein
MTIRRNRRNRNPHGHPDSVDSPDGTPLLTLRAAFILSAALATAAVGGILTYLAVGKVPEAFLAAGGAFAAAITLLNAIVGL